MNTLELSIQRFRDELPQFLRAKLQMEQSLKEICSKAGVLATIMVREKDLGSFVKKAMTKEGYAEDPWTKTTDKVGARVIVQTRTDQERIRSALRSSALTILSEENKRDANDPNDLFYPGIHVQVIVPNEVLSTGGAIECEIQLRTKAEDLWSVPSHKLLHKGVTSPSWETERRIWRLSALLEVFDEEVERAMQEVFSTPNYVNAALLAIAENSYFTIVPVAGERDLSLEVLLDLESILPNGDELVDYQERLTQFTNANREYLESIYANFGGTSDFASNGKYWLFTQPESILLFELISSKPMLIREAAHESEIGYAIEPLFLAWGVNYDLS